jgi:hypothetical protein
VFINMLPAPPGNITMVEAAEKDLPSPARLRRVLRVSRRNIAKVKHPVASPNHGSVESRSSRWPRNPVGAALTAAVEQLMLITTCRPSQATVLYVFGL